MQSRCAGRGSRTGAGRGFAAALSGAMLVAAAGAVPAAQDAPAAQWQWSLDPGALWAGIQRLVELGGPVVGVQLAVSVFGLAVVLYKALQFARVRPARLRALHAALDAWAAGDREGGARLLERSPVAFARDLGYALGRLAPGNAELVREELYRRARAFLAPLHGHLPTIEIIYYIAPLLGLLGTVTGIIASFQALEASGAANDSAQLAGGIWEALVATAVGLSMAIPFAVLHSFLETRLNGIVAQFEDLIARVFTTPLDRA